MRIVARTVLLVGILGAFVTACGSATIDSTAVAAASTANGTNSR